MVVHEVSKSVALMLTSNESLYSTHSVHGGLRCCWEVTWSMRLSLVCERGLGKRIAPFARGMLAMGMVVMAMGMVYAV